MVSRKIKTLSYALIYKFNNDRSFVISFIAIACFALVVNCVAQLAASRRDVIINADMAAESVARVLRQHAEDAIKSSDTTLLGMTNILRSRVPDAEMHSQLLSLMEQSGSTLEQAYAYFVYDENGKQVLRSNSSKLTETPADEEFFKFHQENLGSYIHIGQARRDRDSGIWVIPLSRRVNKSNREFGGVVMVELMFEYFKEYYEAAEVGQHGSVVLALDDGQILVRRPSYTRSAEVNLQSVSYFKDKISQAPSGHFMFRDEHDGEMKHAAFQHLKRYPLLIFVAISQQEVLQGWWHSVLLYVFGVLVLVGALILYGWKLVRRIDIHLEMEGRLKQQADSLSMMNVDLHKLAYEDGLTGLGNRRSFNIAIDNEISRARRSGSPLSLVMIDVDYFKKYNDIYGHAAGDDCLRQIATAIKVIARRGQDLVARYGGEELVILLPGADSANAMQIAELAVRSVERLGRVHRGSPLETVTISAGVTTYTGIEVDATAEGMIIRADLALYEAKNSGKNQVCFTVLEAPSR